MTAPILKYDRFFTGRGGAAGGLSKVAEGDALRVYSIFLWPETDQIISAHLSLLGLTFGKEEHEWPTCVSKQYSG